MISLSIFVLAACGANEDDDLVIDNESDEDGLQTTIEERNMEQNIEENEQTNELATEEEQQSYMEDKLAASYFTEVEIEVEYGNGIEYEVEIERDDTIIKAKIDDEINNQKITGIDAFNFIYERIEELRLTPTSHIDDVKNQIISSFDLPADYKEIKVKVKFQNGSKLELEDKVY